MTDNSGWTQEKEWSLQEYINLVIRRLTVILVVFVLVLAATLAYTLTRKDFFRSFSTFVIESSEAQMNSLLGARYYFSDKERMRQAEFYQALLASSVFRASLRTAATQDSILKTAKVPEELIQFALGSVRLGVSEKTELVTLSARAADPVIAYRVAALALDAFKVRAREVKLEETDNVVEYIENQKGIARQKLEETERALQEFTQNTRLNLSSEQSGLLDKLMELELKLTDVQTQRELAEANIAAYDRRLRELDAPGTPALSDINTPEARRVQVELESLMEQKNRIVNSGALPSEIAALDQRIDAKKDELFLNITSYQGSGGAAAALEQTMAGQIRENRIKEELHLYILKNRERYFRQLLANYRRDNPRLIDHALEESRLKRSKTVFENLFNILLEKGEEARIRAATGTGGIRVIDEPSMPINHIPTNSRRNIILGVILGLALGFGLALVLEFLDNSIRSNDEVERYLGIAVIGTIPIIKASDGYASGANSYWGEKKQRPIEQKAHAVDEENGYHEHLISALRPRDPIVDHYRTLRTNLQFASVDTPIKSLLVTSSIPGEGKTISTANIALSFAELGKKVVIVDGDMRKPMQHLVFDVNRFPGISDYLITGMNLEKVVYPTSTPNLKVVPCGTIPPNPAEMIASRRMTDLIQQLQNFFDLIVVDSPPLTIVTDPVLFATKVSHVLVVIKFASTNWHVVADGINSLRPSKTPILGAILNGIKLGRGYGYYQKYYYKYYAECGERK